MDNKRKAIKWKVGPTLTGKSCSVYNVIIVCIIKAHNVVKHTLHIVFKTKLSVVGTRFTTF